MNDSASFEYERDNILTPNRKITKGTLLTPHSTVRKNAIPRPSFDMDRHERAIENVRLPSRDIDSESDWEFENDRGTTNFEDHDEEEGEEEEVMEMDPVPKLKLIIKVFQYIPIFETFNIITCLT